MLPNEVTNFFRVSKRSLFILWQDAIGKKVNAIHILNGHVIRPRNFYQLSEEVTEMVKLVKEKRTAHASFSRSRAIRILRDSFWPADSSRTFICPTGVGGKDKSIFHVQRMEVAIGEQKNHFFLILVAIISTIIFLWCQQNYSRGCTTEPEAKLDQVAFRLLTRRKNLIQSFRNGSVFDSFFSTFSI